MYHSTFKEFGWRCKIVLYSAICMTIHSFKWELFGQWPYQLSSLTIDHIKFARTSNRTLPLERYIMQNQTTNKKCWFSHGVNFFSFISVCSCALVCEWNIFVFSRIPYLLLFFPFLLAQSFCRPTMHFLIMKIFFMRVWFRTWNSISRIKRKQKRHRET